ncbi:MAG: hypothetical protein QOC70_2527 [Verrucomicrobiota bacterium]
MQFYDVLAGGYRTALTKMQIAGLFEAGQLAGNDPCKEAEQAKWRTIDEVFPLLKHGTTARSLYQPTELHSSRAHTIAWAAAISIFVLSAGSLAGYFVLRGGASGSQNAISARAAANPPAPVSYTIENPYFRSQQERAAQERLNAAQRAREQTQAARLAQDRADAERKERELQNAAGRTERIPPDQFSLVRNVGGSDVRVKIHDNDVTSFDVWINGHRRRQVTKSQGIGGNRTEETLIYSNGPARLYYVWEISGNPNQCLLRVRDE